MKLLSLLAFINQIEKNSFLKVLDELSLIPVIQPPSERP